MKQIMCGIAALLLVLAVSSCVIVGDDVLGTVTFTNDSGTETVLFVELKDDDDSIEEKSCRLCAGDSISFTKVTPAWEYALVVRTASGIRLESDEFTVECGETVRRKFSGLSD